VLLLSLVNCRSFTFSQFKTRKVLLVWYYTPVTLYKRRTFKKKKMKKVLLMVSLATLIFSCSTDDEPEPVVVAPPVVTTTPDPEPVADELEFTEVRYGDGDQNFHVTLPSNRADEAFELTVTIDGTLIMEHVSRLVGDNQSIYYHLEEKEGYTVEIELKKYDYLGILRIHKTETREIVFGQMIFVQGQVNHNWVNGEKVYYDYTYRFFNWEFYELDDD